MSVVTPVILQPLHGATFAGSTQATVRLRGAVLSTGHRPLFFKWYSSLHVPADAANVALNDPSVATPLDFSVPLKVGSHTITLAAKDVAGDSLAELQGVQDAGMAGGPPTAPNPCVIHVFLANMVTPAASGLPLSRANSTLEAEAPTKWGKEKPGSTTTPPETEPDLADYHAVNRIQYRWRFAPIGPPPGRQSRELLLGVGDLTFRFGAGAAAPPVVRYRGPLPAGLGIGNYRLTLRVEDRDASTVGDEVSRDVIITA